MMSLEAFPPGRQLEMPFEMGELVSRIARALEILDRKAPGAKGLVERVHLEATELYPILRTAFHMLPSGPHAAPREKMEALPEGAIPSVGVILEEKVRFLRHMLAFMSALPDLLKVSIEAYPDGIEVTVAQEGGEGPGHVSKRFGPLEAPWFAKDFLRRRIVVSGPPGTVVVRCPRCYSGVLPQKGKLWGWWCPTCGVRLVIE